ncbi:unnamed protein product [Trichogramma brassicae]|uniref:Uncharacterized protein n=1 Tax=Trichogramma brassicae TaxID=86971 RepID=A0A6H5IFJ2_9HYME|nr:unnamed protein product [Trichogramma brassicae]
MAQDNQNFLNYLKLKSSHEEVVYRKIDEKSHEFLRKIYSSMVDYEGQLPNLRDIFRPEAIDWLLTRSVSCDEQIKPEPLIEFLIGTGYEDEPKFDKHGKLSVRRTTPLHQAAGRSHPRVINGLFKIFNRFDANYANESGLTHFHVACMSGCVEVVEKFLDLGQDPNSRESEKDDTPFHSALNHKHRSVAELLLKRGADTSLADGHGYTPLRSIVDMRRDDAFDLARLLFEIGDEKRRPLRVDVRDQFGNTPLLSAIENGYENLTELLLRRGADPNLPDKDESTPLHEICNRREDDDGLAETFFRTCDCMKRKVRIDAKDDSNRTPLQLAVANLLPRVVDAILNRGADISKFVFPTESHFGERIHLRELGQTMLELRLRHVRRSGRCRTPRERRLPIDPRRRPDDDEIFQEAPIVRRGTGCRQFASRGALVRRGGVRARSEKNHGETETVALQIGSIASRRGRETTHAFRVLRVREFEKIT